MSLRRDAGSRRRGGKKKKQPPSRPLPPAGPTRGARTRGVKQYWHGDRGHGFAVVYGPQTPTGSLADFCILAPSRRFDSSATGLPTRFGGQIF